MMPSTLLLPLLDPSERDRLETGRPASRAEILYRYLRERRDHEAHFAPEQVSGVAHARTTRPMTLVRRTMERALASAGHLTDREAA